MKKQNKNGGIRRMYRDDLKPERFTYPRKNLPHGIEFYTDAHLVNRPLFAFHAYARFAEYLMYCAKYGKREQARDRVDIVTRFFAETRRLEQNILSTYGIDKPIPPVKLAVMRADIVVLAEKAEAAYRAVARSVRRCRCPACRGHNVLPEDAEMLESILFKASLAGWISEKSPFYRKPPLTSHHV